MIALSVVLGFCLDLLLGDPNYRCHPIRLIGSLIAAAEKVIRRLLPATKTGERFGGVLLVVLVISISTAVPAGILWVCFRIHWGLGFAAETLMCYQVLALKSLKTESMKVYDALRENQVEKAREAVSMIVGRDTKQLDVTGIVKAAVETVAENTSDGIIAPLLFLFIGGAPAGLLYKAVNTMDSMVGYQNDTYRYFGTAAAKLDDIFSFIPARISAWVMIAAAGILKLDTKNAIAVFRRDRFNHKSPNSAQTESVIAGALRIQLAGPTWYFGKRVEKPTIGDDLRPAVPEDILIANRLLYTASIGCLIVFAGIRWGLLYLIL